VRGRLPPLVAAAVLAGCGGGDEPQEVRGYERVVVDGASVELPRGWEDDPQGTQEEDTVELVNVRGPAGEHDLFIRISLFRGELGGFEDAQLLGKNLTDTRAFELRQGRVMGDRSAEVEGADGAWRVTTDFTPELDAGGDGPRARIVELVAARGETVYLLAVAGPKDRLPELDVERVLGSLRLRRNGADEDGR
jgi:hypothetical protein